MCVEKCGDVMYINVDSPNKKNKFSFGKENLLSNNVYIEVYYVCMYILYDKVFVLMLLLLAYSLTTLLFL